MTPPKKGEGQAEKGLQGLRGLVLECYLFLDEKKFEENTLCAKLKKSEKVKNG